jgi:hypothetical protein
VVAPASAISSAIVGSASIVDVNIPPPIVPNYLQRALSAPIPCGSGSGSGSGRKRPVFSNLEN